MKEAGFLRYFLGTWLRPSRTFAALREDPRRLRFGTWALLWNAFLYTCVYVFLAHGGGAPSSFAPWLAIPREHYYAWNRFLLVPSMFACWILSAGTAHLLCRWVGGKGSFEDTLAPLGFSIMAACAASLLHDLPDSFLIAFGLLDAKAYEKALNSPTVWRTILWICYGSSAALFLVLFPKAIKAAQGIRRVPAAIIGVLAFAVYQGFFLVFNR